MSRLADLSFADLIAMETWVERQQKIERGIEDAAERYGDRRYSSEMAQHFEHSLDTIREEQWGRFKITFGKAADFSGKSLDAFNKKDAQSQSEKVKE